MNKKEKIAIIMLSYIIGTIIGGIILFIWLHLKMGLWGVWMFGLIYIMAVSMPFWDLQGREDAARDLRDRDKKNINIEKKEVGLKNK